MLAFTPTFTFYHLLSSKPPNLVNYNNSEVKCENSPQTTVIYYLKWTTYKLGNIMVQILCFRWSVLHLNYLSQEVFQFPVSVVA